MNTTFRVVIFDGKDLSTGFLSALLEGFDINWLNTEEIDDSDMNSFSSKLSTGNEGFIQSDSGCDDGKDIFGGLLDDFSLTDFECFFVVVNDLKEVYV